MKQKQLNSVANKRKNDSGKTSLKEKSFGYIEAYNLVFSEIKLKQRNFSDKQTETPFQCHKAKSSVV